MLYREDYEEVSLEMDRWWDHEPREHPALHYHFPKPIALHLSKSTTLIKMRQPQIHNKSFSHIQIQLIEGLILD